MRISVRNQLAALVLLSSLLCLAVISIATWFVNYPRLRDARIARFTTIASLKAAQLSSNLALMERSVRSLSSRGRLQQALERYNDGNNTAENWASTIADLSSALAGQRSQLLTLQAIVYPRDESGPGNVEGLVNVTGMNADGTIQLPYTSADGPVRLGDSGLGYPPDLYPNITYTLEEDRNVAQARGQTLDADTVLLLGPLQINASAALFSLTVPVINNTSYTDILGYMSVVLDGALIYDVVNSSIGLGHTGTTLLVGPNTQNNLLYNETAPAPGRAVTSKNMPDIELQFIVPPAGSNDINRHRKYAYGQSQTFAGRKYPRLLRGLTTDTGQINNAGGTLDAHNEVGQGVAVSYARTSASFCDWVLALELSDSEALGPIKSIQTVLIACVFATAFGVALWTFPIAYLSSAPIRRLRDATRNAVEPSIAGSSDAGGGAAAERPDSSPMETPDQEKPMLMDKDGATSGVTEKKPNGHALPADISARQDGAQLSIQERDVESGSVHKPFKIPQKVVDGHHWIEDELTDLTKTFNEMSDELHQHYARLEERVRLRTTELELSKRAAEAANESKTLFIANISHELKTPLNGILGMCAVALADLDDPVRTRRSLDVISHSGELLHHLLTDLLTFSKHQFGKKLTLSEKEFRLRDVGQQLHAIFAKQALEGHVDFTIEYQGPQNVSGEPCTEGEGLYGPGSTGKVRDMVLYGDSTRLLQVCINLVSNSLKFTPAGGTVKLRMRCVEQVQSPEEAHPMSRQHSLTASEKRRQKKAASIDHRGGAGLYRHDSQASVSSEAQPDPNAPKLLFHFEVEDTGPGIAPHLQNQIFEPFVQGDLRLTKKFGGTGLGLSICSQLAHLMSGSITLDSEEGRGSTFTLHIPLRLCRSRVDSTATSVVDMPTHTSIRTASRASSPPTHLSRRGSGDKSPSPSRAPPELDAKPRLVGMSKPYFSTSSPPMASPNSDPGLRQKKEGRLKVLVAEDNNTNAEVVTRMLKLEEVFDVTLAKDGQIALEKVKESMEKGVQYDLIFMDVQMPNLDGRESTRLIREMGYSAPIVALTAFSDEINQKECMDSGMDYFLAKPIRRPALKQVLKTYCPPILEEELSGDPPRLDGKDPFAKGAAAAIRRQAAESPGISPGGQPGET